MGVHWLDKEKFVSTAINKIAKAEIILDIGCGILPQKYIRPMVHICCEPFEQYVEHLQGKVNSEYDRQYVIVNATWQHAIHLFPPKSVDTVFLTDVIEHIEKEDAVKLLRETEKIARQQIVVFTPLGFMPQSHADGRDAWGLDGGVWQQHRSGWQPEDFDNSWDVYVTDRFHEADNFGKKLEAPYGALWAIKNMEYRETDMSSSATKANLFVINELAVQLRLNSLLKIVIVLMKILVKIKRSRLIAFLHGLIARG